MAKRRTKKAQQRTKSKAARQASQLSPGDKSKYARKSAYCWKNGVWGFEVPEPKPWRTKSLKRAA